MEKNKALLKQIKLLIGFLKFRLISILIISTFIGLQPTLIIYINKLLIDNLAFLMTQGNTEESILSFILFLLVCEFMLAVIMQLLGSLLDWLKNLWSKKITLNLTQDLYEKLQKVSYSSFEDPKTLDMFQLATSQLNFTPMQILDNITNIIQFAIGLISLAIILTAQNPLTLVPAVLISLPSFLFENSVSKKMYKVEKRRAHAKRKQGYLQHLLYYKEHAMELAFFDYRKKLTDRMLSLGKLFLLQDIKIMKSNVLWRNIIEFFSSLTYWGYYVLLVLGIAAKKYTLGDFTLYSGAFQGLQQNIRGILRNINQIYNHTLFVSNYYTFLDLSEEEEAPKKINYFNHAIEFKNVSFAYPNTDKKILQNINVFIKKNEKIALVGENGSGKTTFIKLLLGFYSNYTGKILIDDIELRQYKKKDIWKLFGVVFQDYQPYYFTAKENISIASNKDENIQDIMDAARQSGADAFIKKLPKGFNTILGRIFDDGCELSRGQWQKIAISRCFVRQAQIFIMDEPAASLDPKSEHDIYKHFHRHAKDKTTILISHRLSNVNRLDRILVFNEGEIIEEGNHKALLNINGKYAELFDKQSSGYINKLAI